MSRHPISGTCRDSVTGQVRGSSLISVYLAGTSTVASIYTASTGGSPVNSVTSDAVGRFSFYVDESDYPLTQLFKIISSKIGFDSITYDNIPFFSLQCIDTDNTLSANSDKKIPSQKAVKSYISTQISGVVGLPAAATENDMVVANSSLVWVKKTLAEVITILGLSNYVLKSLFNANTILSANTDNTPAALTIAEQRIVGRKTSGNIDDLTISEVLDFVPSVTTGDILIRGASVWERFSFTGTVLPFTKSTAPDGWIICNGSAYSRTTYANLFAVIGTTFGSGNGSTTFNVPDLRNRVAVGSGSTYALAATGGEATHTLTVAEMPSHRHSEIGWAAISGYTGSGSGNASVTYTGYEGGSQAHNNMQPFVALNYIIKY